jgi:two-component system sensor histidine kinase CpxA
VAARELEKLFDPFYRVDPSRASETGGVGLGLAIVKSCVDACGGIVSAANRIPQGLEVRIRLNRADTPV